MTARLPFVSAHRRIRHAGAVMALAAALLGGVICVAQAENGDKLRVAIVETEVAQVQADAPAPAAAPAAATLPGDTPPGEVPKPIHAASPRALYRALIEREVRHSGLPADIAEAVMGVESGYDPTRIGADGEIGLMQVMPSTARMLGFGGTMAEFAAPETNIKYGVLYLSQAWAKSGGDLCTALMKYRAGHGETRFSQLSVDYCVKARARLVAKGYPVTGSVPVATFGFRPGGSSVLAMTNCRKRCLALGGGRVDFAALNNRLAQVAIQVNLPKGPGK